MDPCDVDRPAKVCLEPWSLESGLELGGGMENQKYATVPVVK